MTKQTLLITFFLLFNFSLFAQNIGINTTGVAAASTNLLEVLQPTTATGAGTTAIYAEHPGAVAGATGYALQAIKTGASLNNIAAYLSASGGTNNYGLIVAAGYVGIGTASPGALLQVGGSTATVLSNVRLNVGDGSATSAIQLDSYSDNSKQFLISNNNGGVTLTSKNGLNIVDDGTYSANMTFGTGNTTRMTILSGGNIGIGLTAPASLLHSAGQIRTGIPLGGLGGASATTGSLLLYNSANTNTVNIQSGTTSASYTLTLPTAQATGTQVLSNTGGVLSWANDANSGGTVTSVTASSPLSSSGGATPNISITSPLPIANGGTNITTIGSAGSVTFSNGTQHASTAVGTTGQVLTSQGSGTPIWAAAGGGNCFTNWQLYISGATSGMLGTGTPGSFTVPADVTTIKVAVWGGGGGGAGYANSVGGGGGGGYAEGIFTVVPATVYTVTIGGGGSGGASGHGDGYNGGTTSFTGTGVNIQGTGGIGGYQAGGGGTGGVGSGGYLNTSLGGGGAGGNIFIWGGNYLNFVPINGAGGGGAAGFSSSSYMGGGGGGGLGGGNGGDGSGGGSNSGYSAVANSGAGGGGNGGGTVGGNGASGKILVSW